MNEISGQFCTVPGVDILIAGFVCKSVSMQNERRGKAKNCIRNASGLTGVTFKGIVDYVNAKRPAVVILENVQGLMMGNQRRKPVIFDVAERFKKLDYAFDYRLLNTMSYFLPHRRNRCWMWAFRGRSNQGAAEQAGKIICGLGQKKCWTMEDLFTKVQARPDQPSKKLVPRERTVLKEVKKRVPRHVRSGLVVDVGQSVGRWHFCGNGASPCILPNSKIYGKVGRSWQVLGVEQLMALQGIFKEDFKELPAWAKTRGKRGTSRDLIGNAFSSTVLLAVGMGVVAEGPLHECPPPASLAPLGGG